MLRFIPRGLPSVAQHDITEVVILSRRRRISFVKIREIIRNVLFV